MPRRFVPFAADLWHHRELLRQFTQRNVELRHKGSHLGLIWSFLNPLLRLGRFVMVFGYILKGKFGIIPNETRVDYALGIFAGLTLLHFVSELLGVAPAIIVGNPNFVKKVVFPLEILPAAAVGAAFVHLLISLGLTLIAVLVAGVPLTAAILWLPVVVLPVIVLGLGIAWFFSALGVFFRDIGQVMQFLSMALMWCSGIFFSAENNPAAWVYLRYNPLLLAIDLLRDILLWHRPLNFAHLAYVYAVSLVVCFVGYAAFKKLRPAFADVL
jgi:lipopolysaccharide transport system permease protein